MAATLALLAATTLAAVAAEALVGGYPDSPVQINSRGRALCEASHSVRIAAEHVCTVDTCGFSADDFKYSKALKEQANEADTAFYIYWTFNEAKDEIAIGVDAHNAPGYVGLGISANGGMMGADIWMLREVRRDARAGASPTRAPACPSRPPPHRSKASFSCSEWSQQPLFFGASDPDADSEGP